MPDNRACGRSAFLFHAFPLRQREILLADAHPSGRRYWFSSRDSSVPPAPSRSGSARSCLLMPIASSTLAAT